MRPKAFYGVRGCFATCRLVVGRVVRVRRVGQWLQKIAKCEASVMNDIGLRKLQRADLVGEMEMLRIIDLKISKFEAVLLVPEVPRVLFSYANR